MDSTTRTLSPPLYAPRRPGAAWSDAGAIPLLLSPSAWASFLASFLTAFTVPFVGEMPVGEFVLMAAAAWAVVCLLMNGAWPGPLLQSRLLRAFLCAQLIAFCAYVVSDLYWQSLPRDMARGWSRMIFLAIDLVAVAYLFGCARRNFLVFLVGQCAGAVASALLLGPMFGDMWKFGIGPPLTYAAFLAAGWTGPLGTLLAAAGMGLANFALDFRSFGGLCLAVGVLTGLHWFPPRLRPWLAPLALAAVLTAILSVYQDGQPVGQRATRSDIERSAMITAAAEAFEESPLIGHGSWFSKSRVYDNFMVIRHEAAVAAHVGGFADANRDPGDVAIHSQILVALAEGGLFGGAFFFLFGGALGWALYQTVFVRPWQRLSPVHTLLFLVALWNLLLSPFSGAHRVYIALACGLILLLAEDSPRRVLRRQPSSPP